MFAQAIIRAELLHHQIAVTHDDGDDVIEVMRHAAGELADHFRLLGFDELRLQPPAFGPFFDLLHGAAHRGDKARETLLEDIIRGAVLERINGQFLAQRPGNQNDRQVGPPGAHD